jgi:hypothetical protein
MFLLQLVGMWFLFLATAILNGLLRENFLANHLSELSAHQLSTLLFSAAIFLITAIFIKRIGLTNNKQLLAVGLFWAGLTVAFEFLFFHYVGGKSWDVLLADYNLFEGRLFFLVLVTTLLSPLITSKLFLKQP